MDLKTSTARGDVWLDAVADLGAAPVPGRTIENAGEPRIASIHVNALGVTSGKPPPLRIRGLAPLAPLQRVTFHLKHQIADYLTVTEAAQLASVSKDMRAVIGMHPLVSDVRDAFELTGRDQSAGKPGCTELVRRIDGINADIARLRLWQQTARQGLVHNRLNVVRTLTAKATLAAEQKRLTDAAAEESAAEHRKTELTAKVRALDSQIEGVLHYVAGIRLKTTRQEPEGALQHVPSHGDEQYGRIHLAMRSGEVKLVRVLLRELLSLSPRLMPNDAKVKWLRAPKGTPTLQTFGRQYCGSLQPLELRRYEAIIAYIDEVVGSPYLSDPEKRAIIKAANRGNNDMVPACIVVGIHESRAGAQLKLTLMQDFADSEHSELPKFMEAVCAKLQGNRLCATDWVANLLARLPKIAPRSPAATEPAACPG